jgi:hypothetical protein
MCKNINIQIQVVCGKIEQKFYPSYHKFAKNNTCLNTKQLEPHKTWSTKNYQNFDTTFSTTYIVGELHKQTINNKFCNINMDQKRKKHFKGRLVGKRKMQSLLKVSHLITINLQLFKIINFLNQLVVLQLK